MGKIVEETMLVMVDTKNNNNKFYHVTLGEDNTVTKRWGRVGADGASSTEKTGRTGYERAIASKEKKGYKVSPVTSVGVTVKAKSNHLEEVAKNFLAKDPNDSTISNLISRLVASNQHQIMEQSGGLIKVDDDGTVKTALGVVDLSAINEARSLLSKLQTNTRNQASVLEDYLTIIPQNIGYRRGWETEFLKAENFAKQNDFLKQLEDSVQWRNTTKKASDEDKDDFDLNQHADLFRMRLTHLDNNGEEFARINKKFLDSRRDRHVSGNLRLLNVYEVEDIKGKEDFEATKVKYGNVRENWHGTRSANLLSILSKGLIIPGQDNLKVAHGSMFGNGIYTSKTSTKSLNYSMGYWDGNRTNQNVFMLLADIVMGHEYRPTRYSHDIPRKARQDVGLSGKPYQSIHVKAGTCNVINDEMIVWKTDQVNITRLCEFGA